MVMSYIVFLNGSVKPENSDNFPTSNFVFKYYPGKTKNKEKKTSYTIDIQ